MKLEKIVIVVTGTSQECGKRSFCHVFHAANCEYDEFSLRVETTEDRVKVRLIPKGELILRTVELVTPIAFEPGEMVFMNGYQSWTESHETTVNGSQDGLRRVPFKGIVTRKFGLDRYGDYLFTDYSGRKGELHGFSYCYLRHGEQYRLFGSVSERNGYTVYKFNKKRGQLTAAKDCAGLHITEPWDAFDLFFADGAENDVFDRWFEAMRIPKPTTPSMVGYTSWYNYYQNITETIIRRDLEGMSALPVETDIFQIDDGYEQYVGDWLKPDQQKFPNGMAGIVKDVHAKGMKAGLWLAPFVCETKSDIYKEHPDWLLKDAKGKPVNCGCNWSGFYALDLSNPLVRDYLHEVFYTVLHIWGFDMVKLDFLYAACLQPTAEKTRGQLMCEAMDYLRELCGGKLILGCGVPLAPAFGKVDFCRIGCDVGLDWDDKPIMRRIHRERVSTKNAIGDTIFRRQLDGRAFRNDPDVFILRKTNCKLSDQEKETLATVNGLFGRLLFTSDNAADYGDEQKALFERVCRLRQAEIKFIMYKGGTVAVRYVLDGEEQTLFVQI